MPDTNNSGIIKSMLVIYFSGERKLTSSMKALNNRNVARDADPTE
jgi:hypothetical protein